MNTYIFQKLSSETLPATNCYIITEHNVPDMVINKS